jgi:4-alpha-glucanotransferase
MRASGILMHISSLPSEYGIGTMGKGAYEFADFLVAAKQKYWQILPIGPTGCGDSPYQSFSVHAGNPYFIDFEMLSDEGLLEKADFCDIDWGNDSEKTDYGKIYSNRFKVLKKAYNRFKTGDRTLFERFCIENEKWISNYALFMSIKEFNDGKCWLEWDDGLKKRNPHDLWLFKEAHAEDVEFWEFVQFKFFEQWSRLKEYVNENGIEIIGDIPIYAALDSAEVWVYPDLFDLDEDLEPKTVAGCPPDDFSKTGQLWGNPIYNWDRHAEVGYDWWINRMKTCMKLYDIVRIDHFRGFESYYTIPYGDKTAENGKWNKGPGIEFFRFLEEKLGNLNVIAEDLGFLTPEVHNMLAESGFPGMKVLEFAFDPDSESSYLPYKYDKNCVVYIGTHDNAPIKAWLKESEKPMIDFCKKYLGFSGKSVSGFIRAMIREAFASTGDTVIIQMQDFLELGAESRMNIPSTPSGNWQWRMKKGACSQKLAERIADITRTYGRCER